MPKTGRTLAPLRQDNGTAELEEDLELKCPRKVRMLCWKINVNALPTASNLNRRDFDVQCFSVLVAVLLILKTSLFCPFARQVWAISNLPWHSVSHWQNDGSACIANVAEALDKLDFEEFLVICWSLWSTRNKKCMEAIEHSLDQVKNAACSVYCAYSISLI
ncbi:UNVERIFIED_CONTAM: hypothetical protein Sradi_4177500 [Sesamum radiatum]|uniref:Uncharacterized protein n=1 Tax=Sesamum radiatum TaxID=300843 RepID=A0AAW2P4P3_SESRA